MRSAAGHTPCQQPVDVERGADRSHITGAIRDRPPRSGRRSTVSWAVVADQSDAARRRILDVVLVEESRVRRSVVHEHGDSARVAILDNREAASITGFDDMLDSAHISALMMSLAA